MIHSSITVVLSVLLTLVTLTSVGAAVPPPFGIIHWWDGDGDATDSIGDVDGTVQNGASFAPGLVGQAFSFDGIDDTVSFGNTVGNFGIKDFTIEFWVKTSSTRFEGVLGKRPECGFGSFFDLRIGVTGFLELSETVTGVNYNPLSTTVALNDGVFHHVAVTRKGNFVSIYIDGVLDVAGGTAGVTNIINAADFVIGRSTCGPSDGTDFFTGLLDEISLYERALSASEVKSIFLAGGAGKLKVIDVVIDIRPHSERAFIIPWNPFGFVLVSVNGSSSFDTRTIQPKTVRFGASGKEAAPVWVAQYDENKDGFVDKVFLFRTIKTGIHCDDTSAFLTGLTFAGQWFTGSDAIKTVLCK